MTAGEFDRIVERAIASIPWRYRRRLQNVAFVVEEDSPGGALLGLYEGRPLPHRSVSDSFRMPDHITIYQKPHERLAHDAGHLEQLVRDTVWHEIAHYFGMTEAQVRGAESRRARKRLGQRARAIRPPGRRPTGDGP